LVSIERNKRKMERRKENGREIRGERRGREKKK